MFLHALEHACIDTVKLFPFLLVTYLFMEWLEHGAGRRFEGAIARGGRLGPVIGALLGVVPQCGFSGAAATLYAGRVITLGTLFAVFLATSDEMLPIMISEAAPVTLIVKALAVKVVAGIVFGFILDWVLSRTGRLHTGLASKRRHAGHEGHDIHELCVEEGCACEDDHASNAHEGHDHEHGNGHEHEHSHGGSIFLPALKHSLNVTVFVLVITLLIELIADMGLEDALASITTVPYLSAVVTGFFGFIPNCAISVGVTQLYLDGLLSGSALVSGLCVNAGIGLLVLFRTNRDFNENLKIMAVLLVMGVLTGFVVEALGLL